MNHKRTIRQNSRSDRSSRLRTATCVLSRWTSRRVPLPTAIDCVGIGGDAAAAVSGVHHKAGRRSSCGRASRGPGAPVAVCPMRPAVDGNASKVSSASRRRQSPDRVFSRVPMGNVLLARTDCPFRARHARLESPAERPSAGSRTKSRTGAACRRTTERLRADQARRRLLSTGVRYARSVRGVKRGTVVRYEGGPRRTRRPGAIAGITQALGLLPAFGARVRCAESSFATSS